jgi:hypothetical protein
MVNPAERRAKWCMSILSRQAGVMDGQVVVVHHSGCGFGNATATEIGFP